jgi:hypothetical protein
MRRRLQAAQRSVPKCRSCVVSGDASDVRLPHELRYPRAVSDRHGAGACEFFRIPHARTIARVASVILGNGASEPARCRKRFAVGLATGLTILLGCATSREARRCEEHPSAAVSGVDDRSPDTEAQAFLLSLIKPWPEPHGALALALSTQAGPRVSSYDNALLALYLIRRGHRDDAGRILAALARLQQPDGAIPFSFTWPRPDDGEIYIRSGAAAWVGYAASEYLDAERGGIARPAITEMAHRIAGYLLEHQLHRAGDPRDGLVLGGFGTYRQELEAEQVREVFVPGEIEWASSEHNIDAFFFLRDFGALTGDERLQRTAAEIAQALQQRGFDPVTGQLVRGLSESGPDPALALDCASWGSMFLHATGDDLRAETALGSAELRYRSSSASARGHRPYAHAPIIENRALAAHYHLPADNWDDLAGIWAEGSAGVALAALRLGRPERARQILAELEPLRAANGGMPTFTIEIPAQLDTQPSLAGTAWVELVRYELSRPTDAAILWRKR